MRKAARKAAFRVFTVSPAPARQVRAARKTGWGNAARKTTKPGRQGEGRQRGFYRNNAKVSFRGMHPGDKAFRADRANNLPIETAEQHNSGRRIIFC